MPKQLPVLQIKKPYSWLLCKDLTRAEMSLCVCAAVTICSVFWHLVTLFQYCNCELAFQKGDLLSFVLFWFKKWHLGTSTHKTLYFKMYRMTDLCAVCILQWFYVLTYSSLTTSLDKRNFEHPMRFLM